MKLHVYSHYGNYSLQGIDMQTHIILRDEKSLMDGEKYLGSIQAYAFDESYQQAQLMPGGAWVPGHEIAKLVDGVCNGRCDGCNQSCLAWTE